MMRDMKNRLIACAVALVVSLTPLIALAEDEKEPYDARLEGYGSSVTLDSGGAGLTWLLLLVMGVLCIGVLFKSAGRTHLD